MKKILVTASAFGICAGMALAGGGIANAAQGGFTPHGDGTTHSWCKIARAELQQRGAQAACYATGIGYFGCDGVVAEINRQYSRNPRANGYWAEKHYLTRTPGTTTKIVGGTW